MKSMFTVSPMKQQISLKPGETYRGYITVSNPAEATEDFYYRVSVSPYSVSGASYSPDFETETDWTQIANWITLEEESGVLKPNDIKRVYFTIEVPETAPGGGQYAKIGIASDNPVTATDSGTVQDVVEMGALIYADVEGEIWHGGEILSNTIPGFVATGVPVTEVSLSNTGNVHETAVTTIKVKNVFSGEELGFVDDGENRYETIIMPSSTREVPRTLEGIPQLGIFEVRQTVDYLGQTSENVTTMVICPIWFMALVICLILSIIGMICYGRFLKRKKMRKNPVAF